MIIPVTKINSSFYCLSWHHVGLISAILLLSSGIFASDPIEECWDEFYKSNEGYLHKIYQCSIGYNDDEDNLVPLNDTPMKKAFGDPEVILVPKKSKKRKYENQLELYFIKKHKPN